MYCPVQVKLNDRDVNRVESTIELAIKTTPWWDTIDAIASHIVGPFVRLCGREKVVSLGDRWFVRNDIWHDRT